MGQTGVGKSAPLNKIAPDLNLKQEEISDSSGSWSPYPRAVRFYNLNGGKIADTLGFSSLDYEVTTAEDLNQAFQRLPVSVETVNSVLVPIPMSRLALSSPAVEEGIIATLPF